MSATRLRRRTSAPAASKERASACPSATFRRWPRCSALFAFGPTRLTSQRSPRKRSEPGSIRPLFARHQVGFQGFQRAGIESDEDVGAPRLGGPHLGPRPQGGEQRLAVRSPSAKRGRRSAGADPPSGFRRSVARSRRSASRASPSPSRSLKSRKRSIPVQLLNPCAAQRTRALAKMLAVYADQSRVTV